MSQATDPPAPFRHHLTLWHTDDPMTGNPPGGNFNGPHGFPVFAQVRYGSMYSRCQSCGAYWRNINPRYDGLGYSIRAQIIQGHNRMTCFRHVRAMASTKEFRSDLGPDKGITRAGIRRFEAWWMVDGAARWKAHQDTLEPHLRTVPDYIRDGLYDPVKQCWLIEGANPHRCMAAIGIKQTAMALLYQQATLLG